MRRQPIHPQGSPILKKRNFTWADLSVLAQLITEVRRAGGDDRAVTSTSLREELGLPGLVPEENCFLFEVDGELRAYSLIRPELRIGRTVLELGIHPVHVEAGIERDVVRAALARAESLEALVLHICLPASEFWGNLLREEGFSRVRDYWVMRWDGDKVPEVNVPAGFAVESFRPGDEERLTRIQNDTFGGSWGFSANTVEEVAHRVSMGDSTLEGILFLVHENITAGYNWTSVQDGQEGARDRIGIIGMMGVAPGYRGQGLSVSILLAGMSYLESRGSNYIRLYVDGDNGPAMSLYTSQGFKKSVELHWFESRLSGAGSGRS